MMTFCMDRLTNTFCLYRLADISLFNTTLRHGASNEIAIVSNGAISSSRITNCARSKNAIIHVFLKFHISCHDDKSKMTTYRERIESYIYDKPNLYESIFFFRCEDIDPDLEFVKYHLAVKSRYTWQLSNRILHFRGELHQFCIALSYKLHINYNTPNDRNITYYGGTLVDGGVKDYKANVLSNRNISSPSGMEFSFNSSRDGLNETPRSSSVTDASTESYPRSDIGNSIVEEEENEEDSDEEEDANESSDVAPGEVNRETPISPTDKQFLSMLQSSHHP